MFCPRCDTNVDEKAVFCPNCNTNIKNIKELNDRGHKNDFLDIIKKYKKNILFLFLLIIIIIVEVFLFKKFFSLSKLDWNESHLSSDTKYVTSSKLTVGVHFSDLKKAQEIKYTSTCGKIEGSGLTVVWDLTSVTGKCEITASYKNKKIKREINVIPFNISESELGLDIDFSEESNNDYDLDGLTNEQEKEYNTNPEIADTDMDGLDDYYEIFVSKTNPNKKDSDGDGLNDYDEIKLGLDPNKADTKNDGTKDGDRILTYTYEDEQAKLFITGSGNIASSTLKTVEDTKISNKDGIINHLYSLYSDGKIKDVQLVIHYTDEDIQKNGLNESNLSLYSYLEDTSEYKKIASKINKDNKTISATLNSSTNFVIGDSSIVKDTTSEVLFVLDNSWSMYSKEQYKEYTGEEYSAGLFTSDDDLGSDIDGIRFSLTSDLASKLANKKYKVGLSEFRGDYANLYSIGTNIKSIQNKLTDMTGKFVTKEAGTNIRNALLNSIKDFSGEADYQYVVLLTDGRDSMLSIHSTDIIKYANEHKVKICSIGFGDGSSNSVLANISNSTGCKFYSSGDASGLIELFDNIKTELDDGLVDVDKDNKTDGILIADSGFIVNRDGFSFANYASNFSTGGHCYGMATFAELYYKKVFPLVHDAKTVGKDASYAYNLKNTYFKNYDNLYNYKLKTNDLKYVFGYSMFDESDPYDFRVLNNDVLTINDKYKKGIISSGIYDIVNEKSSLSKEEQLKKWGLYYKSSDNILLNEDKIQKSSSFNKNDLQLFNAIYFSFIKQQNTKHYSSSSSLILWLRNVFGTEYSDNIGADGFVNLLKARLDDKDAPVIVSTFTNGFHAVNAISLVQDAKNPNYYYVGVYDNNYPGEKRYVDVECNNSICVTKANQYYSASDQPIRLSASLEYDLEYFK